MSAPHAIGCTFWDFDAHAAATVFIPAGTCISVSNIGSDAVNIVCLFSAPGFEDFMQDTSVREGQKNALMSQIEEHEIEKKYSHVVVTYREA